MARRVIDIHNHPNWQDRDVDGLVANMDEHGIEKTWLLSWEIPPEEYEVCAGYSDGMDPRATGMPLWLVVEGIRKHPDRLIGGWAPDPRDRRARAKLKAAVNIHGIRICGELKCRMRYDNPDAIVMYRYCAELGLPVLFHLECPACKLVQQSANPGAWVEWYGGDMSVVETMCRLCPDTTFIGHGPGFWREISGDEAMSEDAYPSGPVAPGGRLEEVLRGHVNLHCDLSAGSGRNALERDLEHARGFVTEFQDRIMFGRDMYDRSLMDVLEKLELGEEVMDKVLWANAEKILGTSA